MIVDTQAAEQGIAAAIEPVRRALHACAQTYGKRSDEYRELILLAIELTTAEVKIADALRAAGDALALEAQPIG